MNIDLNLSFDEIQYISKNIEAIRPVSLKAISKEHFFTWSIMFDLAQKASKKSISLESANMHSKRKKYKLKFKFHEAYVLEKFMNGRETLESDPYYQNLARTITFQLNQKLT
jgi:hypothetical protein